MAGEAVSRTSLTLAFQKKQNLEWRKLREHLHLQLQQDIGRIYTNSLYCDLELVFKSTSIQTHRSLLQVRAARFFTKLCTSQPAPPSSGLHSIVLEKASVDYIESFIRSLYTGCGVIEEEDAVQCLEELDHPTSAKSSTAIYGGCNNNSSGDSGLSPESDIYLTPKSSPSEIYHHFDSGLRLDSESIRSESEKTIINLQKTNRSYYTIVPVDEAFIEENDSKSIEINNVLEKELAEQDELLKSFRSIKSKEEKKSIIKKINKPTSLPFSSSQNTKKYKRGCDITCARVKREGKSSSDFRLCNKEDSTLREHCNDNQPRALSLRKEKCPGDKLESRDNTIREEGEKALSKLNSVSGGIGSTNFCVEARNNASSNDILEEEEFMESPGEGMDCELECCKKKDLITDDLLNFPCSPEMDASGGGPDSGLDTSSTGCMPGGGFSSPREHTVSETSGVDLTEAAIGEDMPHDGDVELLLRKPVKSSTSSSVSSDAGTWDSTFPSTHFHDTEVDSAIEATDAPEGNSGGALKEPQTDCQKSQTSATLKEGRDFSTRKTIDCAQTGDEVKVLQAHSGSLLTELSTDDDSSQLKKHHADLKAEGNKDDEITKAYISASSNDTGGVNNVEQIGSLPASCVDKVVDVPPFCSETAQMWKVGKQNNYFINAADLVDETEVLLLPPVAVSEQQDKMTTETDSSEVEALQKSSSTASPCEENVSSTCDLVNKGITNCLNIKAKYASTEELPIGAHPETFSEDVVPFLSSHLSIADENMIVNNLEHLADSNFQGNDDSIPDSLIMKLTPLKSGSGKHDLRMSSGQDIFAEFQKEIKMTEHLEPHINIRKVHGGWKRGDSSSSEDISKRESQSLPTYIFSHPSKTEVESKNESDMTVSTNEQKEDIGVTEIPAAPPSDETEIKQDDEGLKVESESDEKKEGETEARRPSLIRRNTFELDPDDDRLALLRQEYERRQGNLLFQSCIPQFSGHLTGSEGFRDTQSLMMVTTKDEDLHADELLQRSLPVTVSPDPSLTETMSYVSSVNEERVIPSRGMITTESSSPIVLPSRVLSSHDIHTPDSLNNDGPLDSLFHTQMSQVVQAQQRSKGRQLYEPVCPRSKYSEESKLDDLIGTDGVENDKDRGFETEKDPELERAQRDDLKRMSSSFDNSMKPVISGALTCSDVVVEDKRSSDSPKKQKRDESTPIVSGGVSSVDFVAPARPISDSPIMARRKNESAPILSGGSTVMVEPEPEKVEPKPIASVTSAWVVDMSDCSNVTTKPPLEPKRQKKSDEVKDAPQEVKATALGFFVDLKDTPPDGQPSRKPALRDRKEAEVHEMSPGRRNSGVGFFVDLKDHTEPTEKRQSSEGRDTFQETQSIESKPAVKHQPCGFFVNLNKTPVSEQPVENKKPQDSEEETKIPSADKKNALFSMFIDIGEKQDTPVKHGNSVEPMRNKVSSPHLSSHKKLGFRNHTETATSGPEMKATGMSQEGTESPKNTFMYIDANNASSEKAGLAPVKSTSQDDVEHKENKKQGFFMFIETESPVTRRKTLPSGLRPNLNRHSWNLEPRTGEPGDDQHKGSIRRNHKRAHSLSVDRGSVCSPSDDSRSSSSTSLAKSKMRGSSQSLHEATASPEQGSLMQIGEGKQMSSSCHCRLPSKVFDRLPKRTLSNEGKSESGKETPDIDTISEGKLLGEGSVRFGDSFTDSDGAGDSSTTKYLSSDPKSEESGSGVDKLVRNLSSEPQSEKENVCKDSSDTSSAGPQHTETTSDVDKGRSSAEIDDTVSASLDKDDLTKGPGIDAKRDTESKSLETSFVKLSDLDKEPSKAVDSGEVLPSFAAANRMTRSIPETSWIESKLLMTRSIGGGTSSRSLSRLFPHLHTTMTATSSPSNIGRSKSPNAQTDADDNDTQISETSDLSSMQSSMGPSGLEGSTEETDASSSYAGRSGPVSRLGEDLLRMFLEEINPDVTVEVGGRRLKAHKCILSSRCQYFAAMLSGGWVESAGNVISLQGFSYNAVHFALCHIYSGTSNIPDTISIVELATLADMLGLEGLKEVIMYTLKVKYCHFFHKPCTMCAAGVLECLPLAAAYGLDDIYRKSLRWITKYFVRIWPTKGFASLPRELIDKCYQQHVVHMTVDNVLETVMCCDKLLATLPNVRWAEPVFGITSQLLEASIKFIANNFCGVLSSDSFLSLGKELSWNISRLEDSLMAATDRLPPDQACQSHTRLHGILTVAQSPDPPPEMQWSASFVELLRRIQKRVEASLVRQAPRAARCPSWGQMELELRKKIQEAACLVLVPGEEGHRSRHASLARNKSKSGKQRANSSSSSMGTPEKSGAMPRRAGKTMISSSDSSRTSSPAMRRSTSSGEGSGRGRAATVGSGSSRNLLRRSETPPGKEIRSKKRKEEVTTMSTDSLSEVQSNGGGKRSVREISDSVTSRSCISTRPDTPSVRRKLRGEEVVMSADSLAESVASGEKLPPKVETSASAPSCSLGTTRPDTPPVKERGRKCLGRIGVDVTMSTDSLSATEQSYTGDSSAGRKTEVAKIVTIPKSPILRGSQQSGIRQDGSKTNLTKGTKAADTRSENNQPRSPATAARRVVMRQTIVSPRDSPTFRLRSGVTSSPYTGSPSLRRSLLLATRSPTNDNAGIVNNNAKVATPTKSVISAKSEKAVKSVSSPSTSTVCNKRTPTRLQTRSQAVASPVKNGSDSGKGSGRVLGKDSVRINTAGKVITNVSKTNNNATRKVISNGSINGKNKQNNNETPTLSKKGEPSEDKPPSVGSRSGTFLKDEPTILKKPDVDNVQE
ncbi:serine-rich adhesin for platelets isoform X2 [Periplaneta americana]|uniref:serine-rich adhesin for platelets isoform X2 n=1 Tax=Periplaneta americana TaxID=6978 RepID=UPI0037E7AF6A